MGEEKERKKRKEKLIYIYLNKKSSVLFTFYYPLNGRESIVFGPNFRNGDLDGFTRFEVP